MFQHFLFLNWVEIIFFLNQKLLFICYFLLFLLRGCPTTASVHLIQRILRLILYLKKTSSPILTRIDTRILPSDREALWIQKWSDRSVHLRRDSRASSLYSGEQQPVIIPPKYNTCLHCLNLLINYYGPLSFLLCTFYYIRHDLCPIFRLSTWQSTSTSPSHW